MKTQKIEDLEVCKSYQFPITDENSFIILNGVVIHKDLIEEIQLMQQRQPGESEFDNSGFNETAAGYSDVFAYLAYSEEYTGEEKKVLDIMRFVRYQYELTRKLSVPFELFSKIKG